MSNKNTTKEFNLPDYLHIPNYLYQDIRLEKPATFIAAFFCSLHHANKIIEVSTDYLCELASVKKRQVYKILNQLEELNYIARNGPTNSRVIEWIYKSSAKIILLEPDTTSALQDTSSSNSALQDTQLVHSRTPNSCTAVHTDIKDNNKEYIYITYFEKWNELAKTENIRPINLKRKKDIEDAAKTVKMLLKYWPDTRDNGGFNLHKGLEMSPTILEEILRAAISHNWWMICNNSTPLTFSAILKQKHFEAALATINKQREKNAF